MNLCNAAKSFDMRGDIDYTIQATPKRKGADTMPRPATLTPEEARRAKNKAKDKYDKENTRPLKLKFNLKHDADILEKLDSVPSMQGYVKELIRADIARSAQR